jgi:hypothetical protein
VARAAGEKNLGAGAVKKFLDSPSLRRSVVKYAENKMNVLFIKVSMVEMTLFLLHLS